jgi:glycosyltransferase involved in cell wall biosynthesis
MQHQKPEISIVTPSFNMLPYLKMCSASIGDQQVNVEHIVMDGGSTDGTTEWLKDNPSIRSVSEKDRGMYHALNKALLLTRAEVVGHLNCDEQYLPGILEFVLKYFDENPDVDFIAGDFLVIDPQGELLAYRKSFQPRWPYFFSNYLYTTTCTLFYRSKVFERCRFDESYKSIADVIFLYNVLKAGFRGRHIKKYFAAFTYSGKNLSLDPISKIEKKKFNKSLPAWFRLMKPLFFLSFFGERALHKTFKEAETLTFSIFTPEHLTSRVTRAKKDPTYRLDFKRHE